MPRTKTTPRRSPDAQAWADLSSDSRWLLGYLVTCVAPGAWLRGVDPLAWGELHRAGLVHRGDSAVSALPSGRRVLAAAVEIHAHGTAQWRDSGAA